MASDNLTDQHWEAARLAIHGTFQEGLGLTHPKPGEPKKILKFLDYHLGLKGAGEEYDPSITLALGPFIVAGVRGQPPPLIVECVRKFNCTSASFVRGVRLALGPTNSFRLRDRTVGLIALISNQWSNSPTPILEPEQMSEFCEHLAMFLIDHAPHVPHNQRRGVTIIFEMLHSPEWRKHIVTRFWSMFAYSARADETRESVRWCLQNAIELLEFTRGLPDGEGLKWWHCALWFHYDKLDTTVRDEVEKIARDMSLGDGLSDLNLYLNHIGQEIARVRKEVDELGNSPVRFGMKSRDQLVALEGNHHRLSRITAGRQ